MVRVYETSLFIVYSDVSVTISPIYYVIIFINNYVFVW